MTLGYARCWAPTALLATTLVGLGVGARVNQHFAADKGAAELGCPREQVTAAYERRPKMNRTRHVELVARGCGRQVTLQSTGLLATSSDDIVRVGRSK
jgi:hypothetical protein